jgi:DNA-binding NarL/FixJ family response regulator
VQPDAPHPRPLDTLTPRQAEVARLLALGFTVREIAVMWCRSPKTVGRALENAHQRLGTRNAAALACWAARVGLVDNPSLIDTLRRKTA